MKLTTTTMVTVDGVVQGLGEADEDRRGGFERGGGVAPYFDDEGGAFLSRSTSTDAFLFGRWTYETFAGSWGTLGRSGRQLDLDGAEHEGQVRGINHTAFDPKWVNTTVLSGDLAAAVGELKAKPAGELQVHGSGVLIR